MVFANSSNAVQFELAQSLDMAISVRLLQDALDRLRDLGSDGFTPARHDMSVGAQQIKAAMTGVVHGKDSPGVVPPCQSVRVQMQMASDGH